MLAKIWVESSDHEDRIADAEPPHQLLNKIIRNFSFLYGFGCYPWFIRADFRSPASASVMSFLRRTIENWLQWGPVDVGQVRVPY